MPSRRTKKPYLTKSRHLAGLHCPKRLWLDWHDPSPYEDPPPGSPMATGIEVGRKAWELFPGGVFVDERPWEHEAAVLRTRELMGAEGAPAVFEAALEHDGVRIRADILERVGKDIWALHEVKSSARVKDEHFHDLAVQVHVLQGTGVRLDSYGILHIDKEYELGEDGIDWPGLFCRTDLTGELDDVLSETPGLIEAHHGILRKRKAPDIEPSRHCNSCDFWDACTADKPDDWVFYLPRLSADQYAVLMDLGIESISDIPDDHHLTGTQLIAWQTVLSGKEHISPDLWKALEGAGPPALYMDFETMNPAIPIYPGTKPFQRVPFQWSLHGIDSKGRLSHDEFLASGETDPRRDFAEILIEAIGGGDTPIIVYSHFEKGVLGELAAHFPDLKKPLKKIINRLFDLLPVARGYVYHPDFHGSFSIKSVGPALVPNLGYDTLEHIADGQAASGGFAAIAADRMKNPEDIETLRQALLEYCKLDTLALVKVHQVLRDKAEK